MNSMDAVVTQKAVQLCRIKERALTHNVVNALVCMCHFCVYHTSI